MRGPPARRNTTIVAALFYFITIPFLIMVSLGNTHINPILNDIYFFKLDVSQIIPISVENSNLLNSVARSLGLHDFYQVGLWNFCEGYNNEGVTYCSSPVPLYWFNPVEVLVSELLAGAKIALPSAVTTIYASQAGITGHDGILHSWHGSEFCLDLLDPLALCTRWFSLALSILGVISSILVGVAAIIATVITVAAKVALTAQDELNISADIGIKMFVFIWIAAILSVLALFLHLAMGCCCKPQKRGAAYEDERPEVREKSSKVNLPSFVRRRRGAAAEGDTSPSN
uniref:SUR7 protein n=1 Tax=Bionectria ochroleuca TaxID=29856 RepID=A0A8H7NFT2_BIOOC